MNIFEIYLEKIKSIISELHKDNKIIVPDNFKGINAEIPPPKFNCDISTNVAMVLSKINNKPPIELAEQLVPIIKDKDKYRAISDFISGMTDRYAINLYNANK